MMDVEKAQQARKERRERLIAEADKLKQDYLDKNHWKELASRYGVRLPAYYEPASAKIARKVIKKCGFKQTQYEELTGHKVAETIKMNPDAPAWALVGWILEDMEVLNGRLFSAALSDTLKTQDETLKQLSKV